MDDASARAALIPADVPPYRRLLVQAGFDVRSSGIPVPPEA